jgi:hypothetical protein
MKRWALVIAGCCLALFVGVVVHQLSSQDPPSGRTTGRQAEYRFFHCQPRHWRECLLKR